VNCKSELSGALGASNEALYLAVPKKVKLKSRKKEKNRLQKQNKKFNRKERTSNHP
jgi:hypothetical protein